MTKGKPTVNIIPIIIMDNPKKEEGSTPGLVMNTLKIFTFTNNLSC